MLSTVSSRSLIAALAAAGVLLSACGSESSSDAPRTVTQVVTVAASSQAQPVEDPASDPTVEEEPVEETPEAITEADVKAVYGKFLRDAIRGDVDAACDAMTEGYQKQFIADGNAEDQVDLKGSTCQEVMRKSAALISMFYGSDPVVTYRDFMSLGDKATVATTIGTSDPEVVTFVLDDGEVKMSADH